MIVKPTVQELLKKAKNRYELVIATSKRARQISTGSEVKTKVKEESAVTLAANEIAEGKIEIILDGGQACIGLESTIVDLTDEIPTILRPGYITKEMLEEVLGTVEMDKAIIAPDSGLAPKAPGMKYRHYAPKAELNIISGKEEAVVNRINQLAESKAQAGKRVGIIGTDETVSRYQGFSVKSAGNRKEEETRIR